MNVRALVAQLASLFVWRSLGHTAHKLFGFALAEQGSAIDLSMAAQLAPDPARAALYLRHAMDESRHAIMFARRAAELQLRRGMPSYGAPRADVDHLYELLGETDFVAFVHRGECRARTQFEVYQRYFERHDAKTAALFSRILEDERRHATYTRELLVSLAGSERAARKALRRSVRWEAKRTWMRLGRGLAGRLFTATMWLLYLAVAPLGLFMRIRAPRAVGWR